VKNFVLLSDYNKPPKLQEFKKIQFAGRLGLASRTAVLETFVLSSRTAAGGPRPNISKVYKK